jgi:hypothetical protein
MQSVDGDTEEARGGSESGARVDEIEAIAVVLVAVKAAPGILDGTELKQGPGVGCGHVSRGAGVCVVACAGGGFSALQLDLTFLA